MIANNDNLGGSKSANELERKRQKRNAQTLPVMELTHSDFATIRLVGSHEEIEDLAKDHDRLKLKGDCGNWFVCLPKQKQVFLVKFIRERPRKRSVKPGLADGLA